MIQFPIYNPIDFTRQFPRTPWETYDEYLNTFYKSKALSIQFLFRANNNDVEYRADIVTPQQQVVLQINAELLITDVTNFRRFIVKVPIENLPQGLYYIRVMAAKDTVFSVGISELFCIKDRPKQYENILTLSATNRDNRNGIWRGFYPCLHLKYEVKDMSDVVTNSDRFEMSFGRSIDLNTETFSVREFRFGGKGGVSRYLAKAIKTWLYCSDIYIDGDKYTRHSDPEFITLDNYDLVTVSCQMVKEDSMMSDANLFSPVHGQSRLWRRTDKIWTDEQIWLT